jgi:NAD(P)-dependent dehydrogenase (short-subunit alcohol dehydrogenase family)
MDVQDKTVVVTGGGAGIGRAMAQAFAAAGARVVVGDIDAAAAEQTAAHIRGDGGQAVGTAADAGSDDGIAALIASGADAFGPVDVYVANAGVIGPMGLGTPEGWQTTLHVNLLAHIRAATLLIPQWQERGGGHFVSVASAAGLLTQLGGAAYAVTKHAAIGFAEWLAITYGDRGIGVTCVCPMGVNTPLLDGVRAVTDPAAAVAAGSILGAGAVIEPEIVADMTIAGVREGGFLVLPHPEVLQMYRQKGADYDRWIAGMRRYQRALSDPQPG